LDTSRESEQHIYRLAGTHLQAGWGTSTGWLGNIHRLAGEHLENRSSTSTGWLGHIYRLAG
jgi:hypothetical protein